MTERSWNKSSRSNRGTPLTQVPLLGIVYHSSCPFCLLIPLSKFLRSGSDQLLPKAEKWEAPWDISYFSILRCLCSPSAEIGDWNRDEVLWFIQLILLRTVMGKDKDSKFFTYSRFAVGESQVPEKMEVYRHHILQCPLLTNSYVGTKQQP